MPLMPSEAFLRRRIDQRISTNADQTEYNAVIRTTSVVDAGTFDDRIADAADDFDPNVAEGRIEGWNQDDLTVDSLVGETQTEIERRMEMLGNAYPFALDANRLSYSPSHTGCYEFCLAISTAQSITQGEFVALPRQFERTTGVLLREYMGWQSHALHTGWPRDEAVGVRFRTAMTVLNERCGEWPWRPEGRLPDDPDPRHVKDEGVDIIVWKDGLDKRMGHLFLLCQCSCGNDWNTKLNELNLSRFSQWFGAPSRVPPVRSFATPFVLSDGNMVDAQLEAGMVFDRVRLTLIAEGLVATAAPIAAINAMTAQLAAIVLTAA